MFWKGFPAFPAHLRMRPVSRGNSRRATWVRRRGRRVRRSAHCESSPGLSWFRSQVLCAFKRLSKVQFPLAEPSSVTLTVCVPLCCPVAGLSSPPSPCCPHRGQSPLDPNSPPSPWLWGEPWCSCPIPRGLSLAAALPLRLGACGDRSELAAGGCRSALRLPFPLPSRSPGPSWRAGASSIPAELAIYMTSTRRR